MLKHILIGFNIAICTCVGILYWTSTQGIKIELTYYDNSSELLIYDELPYIISTDSTTFCVIDSESKICGVKQFKIHK